MSFMELQSIGGAMKNLPPTLLLSRFNWVNYSSKKILTHTTHHPLDRCHKIYPYSRKRFNIDILHRFILELELLCLCLSFHVFNEWQRVSSCCHGLGTRGVCWNPSLMYIWALIKISPLHVEGWFVPIDPPPQKKRLLWEIWCHF